MTCAKCGIEKPANEFYPRRRACKECVKAQGREYHRANREERGAASAAWRERNRESLREKAREYYGANKERHLETSRQWARSNPEYYRAYNKRWYAANKMARRAQIRAYREARPEWAAEMNRAQAARYLARKAQAFTLPFTLDELAARMAFYGGTCWICRTAPGVEIDHVKPLSKGGPHILANLRPACRSCNASKNATWPFPLRQEVAA